MHQAKKIKTVFFPFRFKNGGLKHIFLPFGPKKFLYASVIAVSTYILSEDLLPNTEVKPGGFYRFDGTLRSEFSFQHTSAAPAPLHDVAATQTDWQKGAKHSCY